MNTTTDMTDLFGEVIYSYSRAQAIEDGELIDVSEQAGPSGMLNGFTIPVAITGSLHTAISMVPRNQDYRGRLHDVLWMARCAAGRARGKDMVDFQVIMQVGRKKMQDLRMVISGGDHGEPVITIGYPQDF